MICLTVAEECHLEFDERVSAGTNAGFESVSEQQGVGGGV